jgi:arylsulfatase A-like enzyme
VAVFLEQMPLTSLTVEQGRRAYGVRLPPGLAPLRWATVLLACETSEWRAADPPFVTRGLSLDGAPAGLAEEREGPGTPHIVQSRPGTLRFALRRPDDAELRFTARVAGLPAPLAVTVETARGPARELWTADVGPGRPLQEVVVRLPGRSGDALGISLHHRGTASSQALWLDPRVLGRGPSSPSPQADRLDPALATLRASLRKASVVVVVLDAASALHVGSYGYARGTTPEMDRLAREGILFERAYTAVPFTVSAVSSLWTSQYPDQHHYGVRYNAPLPKDRVALAEVLSAHGVATAGFVANIAAGPTFGLDRGFAEFHDLYETPTGLRPPRAEVFHEALRSWLERAKGRRFFGYLHLLEPHFPYDPPPPFDTLFGPDAPLGHDERRSQAWYNAVGAGDRRLSTAERAHLVRLYDGNLAYADQEIGRLRRELERAGLLESTVLVVTADHGEALLERGYLGHGEDLHEESVRIPLIVRLPRGSGPQGVRVRGLVDLIDVGPTVADVFGLLGQGSTGGTFEGRSLLPMMIGADGEDLVVARTRGERPRYALVGARYKLIHNIKTGVSVLYDLRGDPREQHDLSDAEALLTEVYRQELYRRLYGLRRQRALGEDRRLTPSEIEFLRALGYVQ